MKKIAFFDFDGTITAKDTLAEIIKFQKGSLRFYSGMVTQIPSYIAFRFKLIATQRAKENMLTFFFKGERLESFQEKCNSYAQNHLPAVIRKDALLEIMRLRELGFEIVIVSASAENWISKWAENYGLRLIATRLENKDGVLTGKIQGKNCNGDEKVARIKSVFDLSAYDEIYAYGDSKGDKPMLALANHAHYKPFR